MDIVDTHAHLDEAASEGRLDAVLERAEAAGVRRILCVGCDLDSSRLAVQMARERPGRLFATVGIHPTICGAAGEEEYEQIEAMAAMPQVVAVGETGLDLHWDADSLDVQVEWFRRHLGLARSAGKPIIVHARKADEQVLSALAEEGGQVSGVRHCFDGDAETAGRYVALGMHLAFGGTITLAGYKKAKAAAAHAPDERLLVETDSPYILPAGAPEGPNEPANAALVVDALAALRHASPALIARITTRNAEALFFGGAAAE